MTRISGTLHEDQHTFMIISCSFLLRMRNVSDKFVEKPPLPPQKSMAKYHRARQVTDDSTAHAHCMLDT